MTVSPGEKTGTVLPSRAISSFSSVSMIFICVSSMNVMASGLVRSADRHLLRTLYVSISYVAMLLLFFSFVRHVYQLAQVFLEQPRFLFAHPSCRKQVGAPQPSPSQSLLASPVRDRRVITTEEYRRHRVALIRLGPCVMRAIEQAIDKRLLGLRLLIV